MSPRKIAAAMPAAAPRLDLSGAGVRHACAMHAPAPGLDPHALHTGESGAIDPWIELLAALGLDPHALWPAAVALDFVGDQWTPFAPPHDELRPLYGIDVHALTVWRPLAEHAIEQLSAGRPLRVDVDAFWLPDSAGHHRDHSKTTIVLNEVDLDARRIAYFHAAGYFEARGDAVTHLLGLEDDTSDLEAIADWRGSRVAEVGAAAVALAEGQLAPHAEIVRIDRRLARSTEELQMLALHHLGNHLAFRPATNPMRRFAERLADDLPLLRDYGTGYAGQWASVTLRRLVAAGEFVARGLAWQEAAPGSTLHAAAQAFERIVHDGSALDAKLQRALASTKAAGLAPLLDGIANAWDDGMAALEAACGSCGR